MSRPPAKPRDRSAGVTLVEMLVALVLLAIIGVAGLSVLEQVLRTQERTAGRLERLAAMQRAMHLLTLDFATALPDSLTTDGAVAIGRQGEALLRVEYRLEDGTLWRVVSGPDGEPLAQQALLGGLERGTWRFLSADHSWQATWPGDRQPARLGPTRNPTAVELLLTLGDGSGLRRVAMLPPPAP